MTDSAAFWEALAHVRQGVLRAIERQTPPSRHELGTLIRMSDDITRLPDGAVTAARMAQLWGHLQLLLVEGGPASGAASWRAVRRLAFEGMQALFTRPEWLSLRDDFRETVLPVLAEAVSLEREDRLLRCVEAARHLRMLAYRTSGLPHAWRLRLVTEMQYPLLTPSGWQARMGDDFSWRRARAVIQALVEEILQPGEAVRPLVVGYDSRIHADELAALVTEIATAHGLPVQLAQHDSPTPALLDYTLCTLGAGEQAGLVMCTASHLPVSDPDSGCYTGHAYQGLRYYTPTGLAMPAVMAERIGRHAMELLLETVESSPTDSSGEVTMFDPREAYCRRVLAELETTLLHTTSGEEMTAREAIAEFWRQSEALVVIDELHGASRGYLRSLCDALDVRYEVLHGETNPVLAGMESADPAPPALADLMVHVREYGEERDFVIGLAFDADGDRLGVVDETGAYLDTGAVLTLLADLLLHEAYAETPAILGRSRTATRALDRLAADEDVAGRILPPPYPDGLPSYMHQQGYTILAGDAGALGGEDVYVSDDLLTDRPTPLLLAGDARQGILLDGHAGKEALRAALWLLALYAVRRRPLCELWELLQQRIGPSAFEHLELSAPDAARRALVNRYYDQYAFAQAGAPRSFDDFAVDFAGGIRNRFIEWTLRDRDGHPAYLSITELPQEQVIRIDVEAWSVETARRLLVLAAQRLEHLVEDELHRAETPWAIIGILASMTSALVTRRVLPGTLNCRLVGEAYSRVQELARPGREAPDLMRFITDQLQTLQPDKARVVAACHLGEQPDKKKTPPPPHVHWESETDP